MYNIICIRTACTTGACPLIIPNAHCIVACHFCSPFRLKQLIRRPPLLDPAAAAIALCKMSASTSSYVCSAPSAGYIVVPPGHHVEPQLGWSVKAFHYYTWCWESGGWGNVPACVFLAKDENGLPRGMQWWKGSTPPTPYHGLWVENKSTMWVKFNCRGPYDENGDERPLKAPFLQLRAMEYGIPFFMGFDQAGRRVKMVQYGQCKLESQPVWDGENPWRQVGERLVWEPAGSAGTLP